MSPDSSAYCPQCGALLPPNAAAGLCPRCVMAMNMAPQTEVTEEKVGPHGTQIVSPPPKAVPSPEEIASSFPQFEVLECLGRGGMGVVYKARQKSLDRMVAIKILAPERERDPQFAGRFVREARTLAQLSHPNIVTVHDFGEASGMFYLVMEFVDGVNLRQLLLERRLAPEEALAIVPSICEALQYAHTKGVVHRDIKPENLLLDKQGRIKITDFGIARMLGKGVEAEAGTQPGAASTDTSNQAHAVGVTQNQIMGTPAYMAPEQTAAPQRVDHRADIYALGVVLYEMLTGELPKGKFEPPSRKVQVDVRIDEIVLQALAKDPERRYQNAGQFKTMVETITNGSKPPSGEVPGPVPAGGGSGSGAGGSLIASFSWGAVPWQIWVVVVMLALEGIANFLDIPRNPNAILWLGAKALFITGLLRRWRPVFFIFLGIAALHVVYYLGSNVITSILNLVMIVLVAMARRYFFDQPWRSIPGAAQKAFHDLREDNERFPPGTFVLLVAIGVAGVWGFFADLRGGHFGFFLLRMLVVPASVLAVYWLVTRLFPGAIKKRWSFNKTNLSVLGVLWALFLMGSLFLGRSFDHRMSRRMPVSIPGALPPLALQAHPTPNKQNEQALYPFIVKGSKRFLDLDSGKLRSPPKGFDDWPPTQQQSWLRDQGVDLLVNGVLDGELGWSLLSPVDNRLKLIRVHDNAWNGDLPEGWQAMEPEPTETIQVREIDFVQVPIKGEGMRTDNTFLFETAQGARGILQLRGIEPADGEVLTLKLRYRRLRTNKENA